MNEDFPDEGGGVDEWVGKGMKGRQKGAEEGWWEWGLGEEGGGQGKDEAMSHISDLDPSGLLFTLVENLLSCVCVSTNGQVNEGQSNVIQTLETVTSVSRNNTGER